MKRKRFQKIYIEIINRCNLCCSFCPTSDRPARMMSVDEFREELLQVTPFTDYIRLHVRRTIDAPMAWRYFGHRPSNIKSEAPQMQCFFPKNISCFWETAPLQISCPCTALHAMHTRISAPILRMPLIFARTFYNDNTWLYQLPTLESG